VRFGLGLHPPRPDVPPVARSSQGSTALLLKHPDAGEPGDTDEAIGRGPRGGREGHSSDSISLDVDRQPGATQPIGGVEFCDDSVSLDVDCQPGATQPIGGLGDGAIRRGSGGGRQGHSSDGVSLAVDRQLSAPQPIGDVESRGDGVSLAVNRQSGATQPTGGRSGTSSSSSDPRRHEQPQQQQLQQVRTPCILNHKPYTV